MRRGFGRELTADIDHIRSHSLVGKGKLQRGLLGNQVLSKIALL
jgi:hypothetical protein